VAAVPQVGGLHHRFTRVASAEKVHTRAWRQAGHRECPRRARKPPSLLLFTVHKATDQRPRRRRDASNADDRFCR
jgi:hypothetical protein